MKSNIRWTNLLFVSTLSGTSLYQVIYKYSQQRKEQEKWVIGTMTLMASSIYIVRIKLTLSLVLFLVYSPPPTTDYKTFYQITLRREMEYVQPKDQEKKSFETASWRGKMTLQFLFFWPGIQSRKKIIRVYFVEKNKLITRHEGEEEMTFTKVARFLLGQCIHESCIGYHRHQCVLARHSR